MSLGTLFVVLGAGASASAASAHPSADRPPLVTELFDPRFADILLKYPMAQNAATEIRDALSGFKDAKSVSLEDHLRTRYRDSDDPFDRRRFYSVAAYLQEVLWDVSSGPALHFDNLDRLCTSTFRAFDHVCFITLNYDICLDRCLVAYDPLDELEDFIRRERWSLIKLHGSITWGRPVPEHRFTFEPPADLDERLGETIFHTWSLSLDKIREYRRGTEPVALFPALTVPVGSDDEITCPGDHLAFLDDLLEKAELGHLLVVGYSGLDSAVRKQLWPLRGKVSSLSVVNSGRDAARNVVERIQDDLGVEPEDPAVHLAEDPFEVWVRSGVEDWLGHVGRMGRDGYRARTW